MADLPPRRRWQGGRGHFFLLSDLIRTVIPAISNVRAAMGGIIIMARFDYRHTIVVENTKKECLAATERALRLCGGINIESLPTDSDDAAKLTCGVGKGWALRLLGVPLSPRNWIPVRLTVLISDKGASRELTTIAEDDFGFGSLVGVEKKFRARCEELEKQLAHNVKLSLS